MFFLKSSSTQHQSNSILRYISRDGVHKDVGSELTVGGAEGVLVVFWPGST